EVLQPAVLGAGPDTPAVAQLADPGRVTVADRAEQELAARVGQDALDARANLSVRRVGLVEVVTKASHQARGGGGLVGSCPPDPQGRTGVSAVSPPAGSSSGSS